MPRTATLLKDEITLEFDYSAAVVSAVKALPPRARSWSPDTKRWTVKLWPEVLAPLHEILRNQGFCADDSHPVLVEIGRRNAQLAPRTNALTVASEASHATDSDVALPPLGRTPRPYQRAGIYYLITKRRTFIADDMGLGKTGQILAALEALNAFPALVVTRAGLRDNWRREVAIWLKGRMATSDPAEFRTGYFPIFVISYESLISKRFIPVLEGIDWKSFTADESHFLKNGKAQRSKAALELVKSKKIDVRFLATGTPVDTSPGDLIQQLKILGRLEDLGGWMHVATRYCAGFKTGFGWDTTGSSNTDELNQLLRATCYIRRMKSQVLGDLPPKIRQVIRVQASNMDEYNRAARDVLAYLGGHPPAEDPAPQVLGEDQSLFDLFGAEAKREPVAAPAPIEDGDDGAGGDASHLVQLGVLRRLAGLGKLAAFGEWAADFFEQRQGKLIVFADTRDVQQGALTVLSQFTKAVATRFSRTPQEAIDAFQSDPEVGAIVLSIKADNAGHNLTAANTVCFLQYWWTPTTHDQCEDRAHRLGQQSCVTAYWFVAEGTVDEPTVELLEARRAVVDSVTQGSRGPGRQNSISKELINRMLRKI